MIITPLFDRVLVRKAVYVDPNPQKEESSIVKPDIAKDEPETGEVVATGEGRILPDGSIRPLAVKVGDWVLFGAYAGQDVKTLDGHALIREDEVLAKLG